MARTAMQSKLTLGELQRLIRVRKRELERLLKRRRGLERKLEGLEEQIHMLGGSNGRHGGGAAVGARPRNSISLNEAIAAKVQATGYRSNSANFRGIVNQALVKDKRFKSAGRGVYEMKKAT